MPGPITYAAVTLLARDRLGQIRRALAAKKAAGTAKELELHVLHLAGEAERMMSAAQPVIEPPVRLYGPPLTDHVSRFTLLGAVGPDLPRYAAYFAPGQRWLFDTLHKGTPDEHREKVLANTTNLIFDFWKRVGLAIATEFKDQPGRGDQAKDQMRAYVLGHLCHIAADVLSHPYFEAIEGRLTDRAASPPIRAMRRDAVAAALDARVADTFFGRGTDTHAKKWADWFPAPVEVPASFAKAMAASIEFLYGARAEGLPAFEAEFKKHHPDPPAPSAELINESLHYFRTIFEVERVWTLGDWLGATAAMFLPMALAYPAALALPLGSNLSRPLTAADGPDAEAVRTYESVVFPFAASALVPLVTMGLVSATGRGLGTEGVTGWIQAGLSLVASIGFFATLGGAGAARWMLWFATPIVVAVGQILVVLERGGEENARTLLWLGPLVQLLLPLVFMLLYRGWLHEGVEELQKDPAARDNQTAFGDFAAWIAIVAVLWLGHALLWRYVFADGQDQFARGEPRQFLRLYDDVALIHDAAAPPDSEKLADLAYPPARRPLLKLWWEAGTAPGKAESVKLRIDQDRLEFHWDAPAGIEPLSVYAPIAPTTVGRFGQLLAAAVTGDTVKGTLHVEPVRGDEKDFELAPGAVFSDHGDDKTTLAAHDKAAALFEKVSANQDKPFILFHAPRPRLALRMGRGGAAPDGRRLEQPSTAGSRLQLVSASLRQYRATSPGGASPLLRSLLRPGDVLEILSATPLGEQRIVEQVISDTDVIVASVFSFKIDALGIEYKRAASDRGIRVRGRSNVISSTAIGPNELLGRTPSLRFGAQFKSGDVIELDTPTPVRRTIVAVKDATPSQQGNRLELDAPPPAIVGEVAVYRLSDVEAEGFPYVADAGDVFGDGGGAMNDAADLATLLCLGAASRLAPGDAPITPDGAETPVHRVYQVFRNWNLDRRRVNEWTMLVSGGATSELRDGPRGSDEAAPIEPGDGYTAESDAFLARRMEGEATARQMGWLPVFRSWMDAARRPGQVMTEEKVFRPGSPPNRVLSRAMAFLLDAREGVMP